MSEGSFSLKDDLFNASTVHDLAAGFEAAGVFEAAPFERRVMTRMLDLELKQRINWIAEVLQEVLPQPFEATVAALLAGLPPPLDPTRTDDDFGRFIYAPLGVVVEHCGMDAPELALDALGEITQRFSMEFSIRTFLVRHKAVTLARLADWSDHPNYHVRRLVSEGSRPRLPWGTKVDLAPEETLPLLDRLHADPTRFVTRSVANHLNDLSKVAPELVMARLRAWQAAARQEAGELAWMIRHALRTQVKAGDPAAMALLGYNPKAAVEAVALQLQDRVRIGEALEITARLAAARPEQVIVNYEVTFPTPRGQRRKVFRLKDTRLDAGETVLGRRHPLKGGATTFTLYPGRHEVRLLVNGIEKAQASFELLPE